MAKTSVMCRSSPFCKDWISKFQQKIKWMHGLVHDTSPSHPIMDFLWLWWVFVFTFCSSAAFLRSLLRTSSPRIYFHNDTTERSHRTTFRLSPVFMIRILARKYDTLTIYILLESKIRLVLDQKIPSNSIRHLSQRRIINKETENICRYVN
jgi:hypothetical protein